ncbi:bombesin receptor-activated protein C6orf89 homolog [Pseudorasbora parva]|uniref:bombesin receptor-activated protein C6orf89 homolog n=1 Tax=Pseudorasbora parva TaxID=51549 RepID=UPI00351E1700
MGSSLSEPCIYDKLSESIEILRQSGYRYGMSEREIEKFIKQVLETNEPRREPPQFPILRAVAKFVLAVCVLLLAVLVFSSPLGSRSSAGLNSSSPLAHTRLLALPIAHKYNLQGFHQRWASDAPHTAPVNCSACADETEVMELTHTLRVSAGKHRHTQPLLLKGGASLSRRVSQLDQFSSLSPTPANFTLLWSFSSSPREAVLHWLFPEAELCPLLENTGTTLQRCQLSTSPRHTRVQVLGWLVVADGSPDVRVVPVQRCQNHCGSFSLWLEPGDMVFADPRYWLMELAVGAQDVRCDGPVL